MLISFKRRVLHKKMGNISEIALEIIFIKSKVQICQTDTCLPIVLWVYLTLDLSQYGQGALYNSSFFTVFLLKARIWLLIFAAKYYLSFQSWAPLYIFSCYPYVIKQSSSVYSHFAWYFCRCFAPTQIFGITTNSKNISLAILNAAF